MNNATRERALALAPEVYGYETSLNPEPFGLLIEDGLGHTMTPEKASTTARLMCEEAIDAVLSALVANGWKVSPPR